MCKYPCKLDSTMSFNIQLQTYFKIGLNSSFDNQCTQILNTSISTCHLTIDFQIVFKTKVRNVISQSIDTTKQADTTEQSHKRGYIKKGAEGPLSHTIKPADTIKPPHTTEHTCTTEQSHKKGTYLKRGPKAPSHTRPSQPV